MRTFFTIAPFAAPGALALLLDCGGHSSGGAPGASTGAESGGGKLFDAFAGPGCQTWSGLSATELARLRARFVTFSQSFAPAGSTAESNVAACADAALAAGVCPYTLDGTPNVPACAGGGPLPNGAACSANEQCQSGACPLDHDGDGGEPCGKCTQVSFGDVGAVCGQGFSQLSCKQGLACTAALQCALAGHAGAACRSEADCAAPLVCTGTKCEMPAASGQACTRGTCAAGLACSATSTCLPIVRAGPGQACDGQVTQCKVGGCLIAGVCPDVIADGAPCMASAAHVCDAFAKCVSGTCQIGLAPGCP
jgi:hypothetical protein